MENKFKNVVGADNYRKYIYILKIVLGAIFLGVTISTVLQALFGAEVTFSRLVVDYITILFFSLAQGLIWITVIFMIIKHKGIDIKVNVKEQEPKLKNAIISPVEPIIGVVFSTIFMVILYFSPELFAAYIPLENKGLLKIPFFNTDALRGLGLLIIGIYITGLAKDSLKLFYGKWNLRLAFGYSILSAVSMILFIWLFFNPVIWNPNFTSELMKYIELDFNLPFEMKQLINGTLLFIIAIHLIDIITAVVKGIKYNRIDT